MLTNKYFRIWFDAANDGGGNGSGEVQRDSAANREKTFTQAELDRIIGERVPRAEQSAVSKLLEGLGVKTQEELKNALGEFKKLQAAERTETQRLQQEQERLKQEAEQFKTERDDLEQQVRQLRAEQLASRAGAVYPDLVAAKIPVEALDDEKKLNAAIENLRKEYPALFGLTRSSADGGEGNKNGRRNDASMNAQIRHMAGRG